MSGLCSTQATSTTATQAPPKGTRAMATKAIVGEKLGMTQVWRDDKVVPVTVLKVTPCRIVQIKHPETDGYSAVQVAVGSQKEHRLTKPLKGQYDKAGVAPGKQLVELRLDDVSEYEIGQEIGADVLEEGELVDATGVSKGQGFTGVMKRHNFKGQRACLLYTSPSPRDATLSRMPSSA